MENAADKPSSLEECWERIAQLNETVRTLNDSVAKERAELEKLRKLLAQLLKGNRSERHISTDPRQQFLSFGDEAELEAARKEAEIVVQQYTVNRQVRKRKRRDESLPANLPRVERVMEVPRDQQYCDEHGERKLIGYDRTESLVIVPSKLHVEVTLYPKFACEDHPQCGIVSPERPTSLVEGDKYRPSVAAFIVTGKWFHYLPLYRLQDIFAASGWTPSRSTLVNITNQVVFVLTPFVMYMKGLVQVDVGVGLDDTGCRMLLPAEPPPVIPGNLKNQRLREKIQEAREKGDPSLLAKMWAYSGLHHAPYNIFDFRVSRHRDGPDEFFRDSHCIVQGDCFSGNRSVVIQSEGRLKLAACWAHARRKLLQTTTYCDEADVLLDHIGVLFDIERRCCDKSWEERQEVRQREATLVLDAIKRYLDSFPPGYILPKSDFADAIGYVRNQWKWLCTYVSDGRVCIDNNLVEQLMKQVALGRKAWLFVDNVESGERSALLMSIVSSARRHDLDVWVYLNDVLEQVLAGRTDYHGLLPDVWKLEHPEAVRQYRVEERDEKADRQRARAAARRLAS
jgi:transposase